MRFDDHVCCTNRRCVFLHAQCRLHQAFSCVTGFTELTLSEIQRDIEAVLGRKHPICNVPDPPVGQAQPKGIAEPGLGFQLQPVPAKQLTRPPRQTADPKCEAGITGGLIPDNSGGAASE